MVSRKSDGQTFGSLKLLCQGQSVDIGINSPDEAALRSLVEELDAARDQPGSSVTIYNISKIRSEPAFRNGQRVFNTHNQPVTNYYASVLLHQVKIKRPRGSGPNTPEKPAEPRRRRGRQTLKGTVMKARIVSDHSPDQVFGLLNLLCEGHRVDVGVHTADREALRSLVDELEERHGGPGACVTLDNIREIRPARRKATADSHAGDAVGHYQTSVGLKQVRVSPMRNEPTRSGLTAKKAQRAA